MAEDFSTEPSIQAEEAKPEALVLDLQTAGRVNFASAQNDVALIRSLRLKNHKTETLEDLTVTLTASPPVIREKTWKIDRLAPDDEISVRDLSTPLDLERLAGLNEAEHGMLRIVVDGPDGRHLEEERRVELLARDEWGGVGDMAQILAAFVSPNDTVVASLLKEASVLLERAGHDGSLDGYQSGDPQRAWLLAGAIWSAATGMGLSYAEPPASFEREGQKVRGPGRIKSEGLATCMDSTLLLAAAYEAAGLNPVILFSRGHAWVGVWLVERDFGYVTEPDVVAVRKAVQAREFVPVETTLLTKRPTVGFEHAADEGSRRLSEEREDEFVMAVDISRSRAARIRPLASHAVADTPDAEAVSAAPAALPKPLDFGLLPGEDAEVVPDTPGGRIERWQRKLLDLSLRNRLLSFKPTKQVVPVLCADVSELEDALAEGQKFKAYALRDDDPVGDRQVTPEERRRIEEDAAHDAFERRKITVPLDGKDMNARLTALYRRTKSDLQEGGTNTLFLAAGFLRWKRTEGDTRTYRAPLLLIPVKLERRSAQSEFSILHHEDDVRFNSTLLEFLKRDFDLRIPELEGELPRDDKGIDVARILQVMRGKVRDVPGFEVVEEVALSTFSFAKYLMWKDLIDRTEELRQNALVKHLVDNPTETFETGDRADIAPHDLDARLDPVEIVTPLPADSSQLAAVVAAAGGRDFVLIGPPGTGKSQTISNIISQCLASGKTVLFVAEKAAALDVVHRRLAAHGLGDAVLELHSNKSDRKSVIRQLGRSWDRATAVKAQEWVQVTEKLRIARDRLNDYVNALHAKGTQGFSVYDAIGWVAAEPDGLALSFPSKDAHDEESFRHMASLAADLGRTHSVIQGGPALTLVASTDWSFAWEADLLGAADQLRDTVDAARRAAVDLSRQLGLKPDPAGTSERLKLLSAFGSRIDASAHDISGVPDLDASTLKAAVDHFKSDVSAVEAARRDASALYDEAVILRMPLETIDGNWREASAKFWPFSAFGKRRVRKLLQSYAASGAADPTRDLSAIFQMKERLQSLDASPVSGMAGPERDVPRMLTLAVQALEFRQLTAKVTQEVDEGTRFGAAAAELAQGASGALRDALEDYTDAHTTLRERVSAFEAKGGFVDPDLPLGELSGQLENLIADRARIADWTRWIEVRARADLAGLAPLADELESGRMEVDAELAFRRAYARWWLPLALDSSEELRRFAHWDHEDVVRAFRELDDKASDLAPAEVLRRIQHGLPTQDGVPRKSELGTLRHQLGLQRPSMPIRTLLGSMPETFSKLAPCVLMSPLSIAQYLPAGQAAFDVVIFDEASQITTWDAIGAIARGRQAVIVGDPKQLPPTNFFGRTDDGDDDLPEVERDMPSILDEVCYTSGKI